MKRDIGFPAWWLVPAGILRIGLMAIGFHGDLYSIYWRAHQAVYHGQPVEHNQFIAHIVHIVWLWILRLFHLIPSDLWIQPFEYETGWRTLATHSASAPLLVLLKLPYLAAEIGAFYILLKLVPFASKRKIAAYWLFNPLILYGVHLYGRYESFPVLFILLALLALHRGYPVWGLLSIIGSVLVRFYSLTLVPLYLWLVPRNRQERIRMLLVTVVPLILVLMIQLLQARSLSSFRDSAEILSLLTMPHRVFLFAAYVPLLQADVIYLFPLGLALLYLAALDAPRPADANQIWRWGAWLMYWLFTVTYFHPQWTVWLVPFLAIQRVSRSRVMPLTWIMAVCLVFYTFQFDREASVLLFAPLSPNGFEMWPHPMELLDKMRVGGVLIGVLRTVFSACLIHLAWMARHDVPLDVCDRSQDPAAA